MALADIAAQNLLSPMALFFALGFAAALARSDLAVPGCREIAQPHLLMSIGFKGGVGRPSRADATLATTIAPALLLLRPALSSLHAAS